MAYQMSLDPIDLTLYIRLPPPFRTFEAIIINIKLRPCVWMTTETWRRGVALISHSSRCYVFPALRTTSTLKQRLICQIQRILVAKLVDGWKPRCGMISRNCTYVDICTFVKNFALTLHGVKSSWPDAPSTHDFGCPGIARLVALNSPLGIYSTEVITIAGWKYIGTGGKYMCNTLGTQVKILQFSYSALYINCQLGRM